MADLKDESSQFSAAFTDLKTSKIPFWEKFSKIDLLYSIRLDVYKQKRYERQRKQN